VRAFAEHQGRLIRYARTYKGECHWSEKIDDQWYMFAARLSVPYARKIDGFDDEGKHFHAPVKCPMGPVRCLGLCEVRKDTAEIRKARIAALRALIATRPPKPRAPQLPYVLGKAA
jgi:hypothetical protein